MTFERTFDYELVRRIITHPKVYRSELLADHHPARENFAVDKNPNIWYVLMKRDDTPLGVFIWIPVPYSPGVWGGHVALLPEAWGSRTRNCRAAIAWLAAHSDCKTLRCRIPEFNGSALSFVLRAGFKMVEHQEKTISKNGIPCDQFVLETAVKDYVCSDDN